MKTLELKREDWRVKIGTQLALMDWPLSDDDLKNKLELAVNAFLYQTKLPGISAKEYGRLCNYVQQISIDGITVQTSLKINLSSGRFYLALTNEKLEKIVKNELESGSDGLTIARKILTDGYTIEEACAVLSYNGFSANIITCDKNKQRLCVSHHSGIKGWEEKNSAIFLFQFLIWSGVNS